MRTVTRRLMRSRRTPQGHRLRASWIALLIAFGTLAGPAVPSALADSAAISGTVTDALSNQPAPAVQVNIFDASGTLVSSTCTGADGTYFLGGLSSGDYRVGFESTQGTIKVCGGHTNYLAQFYDSAPTLAAAQTVTLAAGSITAGINAALEPGGAIAGRITDATNSSPVANVEVDAFDGAGSLVSATCTAGDGTYSLFSLATGSYRVEALNTQSCGQANPYRTQFYDGQTTLAAAHPVNVNVTQTTAGIDLALIPTSARTLTVTISGPGTVGFSPSGASCARSCVLPVIGNPKITLTGTPASGYKLAAWSGGGCSGAFVCTVQMSGDQRVTASFLPVGSNGGAPGSGSGSGSGSGGPGGGGASSGVNAANSACTLSVVPGAIHLTATQRSAGTRRGRSRAVAPAVTLRYRCRQPSRLTLRATFAFTGTARVARGRHLRPRTLTAGVALAPRSIRAGTGTLTVRLPAAVVRALHARPPVSGRFSLRYSTPRGSAIALARIARLRLAR